MIRRLSAVLIAGMTAFTTMALISPSSSAADDIETMANCSRMSCAGKNPNTVPCVASSTQGERFLGGGLYTLQLRFSSGCGAFWARIVRDDCDYNRPYVHARVERQLKSPYGWYETHHYYKVQKEVPCNGGTAWTYMAPNTSGHEDRFRACFNVAFTNDSSAIPEGNWDCTNWTV